MRPLPFTVRSSPVLIVKLRVLRWPTGDSPTGVDRDGQRSAIDSLISDIGALPILASSYEGSSSGSSSLSTMLLATASKIPIPANVQEPQSMGEARQPLPKHSIALKLAQHYIANIYPRLPFFSIQGFWSQFDYVYSSPDPTPPDRTNPTGTDSFNHGYNFFTVLIVLAVATSSLSRSTDSTICSNAEKLFLAALLFRESANLPNTVVGVQSTLFLIQFATLNPSILDSWYLIGVGMRNCIDLGLHQDPQPLSSVSHSLLETRRRLWWSMYSFDRSMSLSCGRPTEISDDVIGAEFPSFRIGFASNDVEIAGYLQRYRILALQSLIYDILNGSPDTTRGADTVIRSMRERLESWKCGNSPLHDQALVESELLMTKILLYRPCQLIPERSKEELEELWDAARGFSKIYRTLAESNGLFYVRIASEKVYWIGLAMLFSYWKLLPGTVRPIELWMAAQDVTYVLRTLSERWEDGKLLGTRFEETSTKVIEIIDGQRDGEDVDIDFHIPDEVKSFCGYCSLTSIWAAADRDATPAGAFGQTGDDLHSLIAEMSKE